MDNSNCNTEHKKYQHLTSEERHIIEVRLNIDKWYFCNVHHREKCLIRVIFSNSICRKSRRKSRLFPPQKTLLNFLFR